MTTNEWKKRLLLHARNGILPFWAKHAREDRGVLGITVEPGIGFVGDRARRARRAQFGQFRLHLVTIGSGWRRQDERGIEIPRVQHGHHLGHRCRSNA